MWEKIAYQLKKKGITKYRLAKLSGLSEETLTNIKLGRSKNPSFYTVYKIAKALDVSLEALIPDEWKIKGHRG